MPEFRSYDVQWSIVLDAESEQDAARAALGIMRDPESTALVFTAREVDWHDYLPAPDSHWVSVDLLGS